LIDVAEWKRVLLPVPQRDYEGEWDGLSTRKVWTTKHEYFDEIATLLDETGQGFSLLEAFEVLGVCPRGFVDPFSMSLIGLESHCATYYKLPDEGGVLDQRAYFMSAFAEIRTARDDYYNTLYKKRGRK